MKPNKTPFLSQYEAILQSGIPQDVIAAMTIDAFGVPFSIRGTELGKKPNQRFESKADSKPTAIHTKSSNAYPCRGHIAERGCFTRVDETGYTRGIDLTDHTFGAFAINAEPNINTINNFESLSTLLGHNFNECLKISENPQLLDKFLNIIYSKTNLPLKPEELKQQLHQFKADLDNAKQALKTNIINKYPGLELQTDPLLGNVIEVRALENRVCYTREVPFYKKAKPADIDSGAEILEYKGKQYVQAVDPLGNKINATKYFIQETQTLESILLRVQQGQYLITDFNNNLLKFKYPKGFNNEFSGEFEVDLNNYIDLSSYGNNWKMQIRAESEEPVAIPEILQHILDNNKHLLNKSFPVATIEENIKRPLMVQAGNTGHPVTGDFDLMHVGIMKDMPSIAYEAPNTYTDGTEIFRNYVTRLRDRLTLTPDELKNLTAKKFNIDLNDNTELEKKLKELYGEEDDLNLDYTKNPLYSLFAALKVTTENNIATDPLNTYLKTEWLQTQGKMHIGAYLFNCAINLKLGINMLNHGEESFNPGESEDFGALTHFYKGQIFHTNTEQECLDFIFHDKDFLKYQFLNIHPSCLRNRLQEEAELTKAWMDIIEVQIINGFSDKIKPNTIEAFNQRAAELNKPKFADLVKDIATNPNKRSLINKIMRQRKSSYTDMANRPSFKLFANLANQKKNDINDNDPIVDKNKPNRPKR